MTDRRELNSDELKEIAGGAAGETYQGFAELFNSLGGYLTSVYGDLIQTSEADASSNIISKIRAGLTQYPNCTYAEYWIATLDCDGIIINSTERQRLERGGDLPERGRR